MNTMCVPFGPSYVTSADTTGAEMMKIIQTPALIVILNPDLTYRQVFMDGRTLERDPNPAWMGYSVGHWEGDTLVVESNGYNDRTWLDHDGHPHTEALRMTERYRRRDFGHMDVEITYSDPKAYARPWTVAVRAELAADTEMIEFVCGEREANPGIAHWVGKASDERKSEVKVAPRRAREVRRDLRRAAQVLEARGAHGRLHGIGRHAVRQHGRARAVPLVAQSPTLFSGLYGLGVAFVTDAGGVPASMFVKHVSGDYRFAPKK